MKGTKSQIIGGGNLQGGTIKGVTQYKPPAKEITPEVLDKIKEEYSSFVNKKFYNEDLIGNYIFMHDNQLIVQIFNTSPFPEAETSLINTDGEPLKRPERKIAFSLAKVLAFSPNINQKVIGGEVVDLDEDDPRRLSIGDIVCFRDFDVATMINPGYEVISSAEAMNKSNARMDTKSPSKYMNNLGNKVRGIFFPNKLDLRTQHHDNYIFEMAKPEVRFKVKDPMVLIDSILDYELEKDKS